MLLIKISQANIIPNKLTSCFIIQKLFAWTKKQVLGVKCSINYVLEI